MKGGEKELKKGRGSVIRGAGVWERWRD